ncbi:MAG: bifunctional 3,4-dihydroxy-2-butanone-4-phosphate synthase/GTP cyclohydrolase II [bacterium]|nr:bifunctional 3,4-dihydroxy-2-butanone-4-phosphate synthase/GTP cyclohydrolase II [bacterium]
MCFSTIPEALEDLRQGKMLIVIDDEDRENEGDLTIAAEKVTPEAINFMAQYGRGLICLPMTGERLDELKIPMMVQENTSSFETAFTVSIEAKYRTTTGISAADRAATVLAAIDPKTRPEDLARPGHMFPLRAREGGVLARAGQTEAAVDLARLAGLYPAGVICEIMNPDGTMARLPSLIEFSKKHGIKLVTIKDLITFRLQTEKLITRAASFSLPTLYGIFQGIAYQSTIDKQIHIALVMGSWSAEEEVLVRVHSECLTGDALGSLRCDCGAQLKKAMEMVAQRGKGVILYLHQEGRGIGLLNKLRAYELQDGGKDTVEANEALGFKPDLREYGIGAQVLRDLGLKNIQLLTNNPRKIVGLEGYGLKVVSRIPIEIKPCQNNVQYLKTKKIKLGHMLTTIEEKM